MLQRTGPSSPRAWDQGRLDPAATAVNCRVSARNHAQGVRRPQNLDMQATIVMSADVAVFLKRERNAKSYGAEVVALRSRLAMTREAIARGNAEKRGATLAGPMRSLVIAGQGTAGREIAEDMAALGLAPDIVVAPASGVYLIAGRATAVKARCSVSPTSPRRARSNTPFRSPQSAIA